MYGVERQTESLSHRNRAFRVCPYHPPETKIEQDNSKYDQDHLMLTVDMTKYHGRGMLYTKHNTIEVI